jgi:hypothetical protein
MIFNLDSRFQEERMDLSFSSLMRTKTKSDSLEKAWTWVGRWILQFHSVAIDDVA